MGYEILSAVDNYGNELNTETKRKLQQRCIMAPRFLREMLEAFHDARQNMMWINRIAQSREGCAVQMDTFADMIRSTVKELEDSMFTDERLEKKISIHLKQKGIRVLYTNFFMNPEGKYEVHVTARALQNECVTTKELVNGISEIMGRRFVLDGAHGQILGKDYTTVVCIEGPAFYTLQGVARIGKGCNQISGDNFMMMELPGGRQGVALSDGMGSGEKACRESTLVIELLEELLEAGFPEKTAIQMINTTLVMGREEIHFSTIDMSVFDLYSGVCELIKAGASSTFIKKGDQVEHLSSTSLPIGVLHTIEIDSVKRTLGDGDFVIMVTDGIMDALPVGEQDILLETIIRGTVMNNPREMAHHILEQVLNWTGELPMDDMTVLVVGMWETN
jgi:stage II sporulation protein E